MSSAAAKSTAKPTTEKKVEKSAKAPVRVARSGNRGLAKGSTEAKVVTKRAAASKSATATAEHGSSGKEEATTRIRIKIRAYDSRIIDLATKTIVETAERHDAKVVGPVPLPTEKVKFTVNRSTFVHKNAREQFEMRVHKRLIDIINANPKCIDALMSLSLPAGVDVEIKM